jgi:hypothetical protein
MKLLIMQSSPASRHFLPLRFKYSPQHPVLRHPQSLAFPWRVATNTLNKQSWTAHKSLPLAWGFGDRKDSLL